MAKKNANHHDLSRLPTFDKKHKELVNVVVETPRASRNKFAYDEDLGVIRLKKVLPPGMEFPYDFGFVPSTEAADGDPLDVLLLMDEPAHPGTLMRCRIVGIIEGRQSDGKESMRNDRLLAVSEYSLQYADIQDAKDLDKKLLKSLEDFFVNYHALDKQTFKFLGCKGAKTARKALEKTRR